MVPLLARSLVPLGWDCQFLDFHGECGSRGSVQAGSKRDQGRSRAKRIASSICCILSADRSTIRPLIRDFGLVVISSTLTPIRN